MFDLRHFITNVESTLAHHNLGLPGAYRLKTDGQETGFSASASACAAEILYTLNRFPGDPGERQTWIGTLQGLQSRESGLFEEAGCSPTIVTARVVAALDLFNARPRFPLEDLAEYKRLHALSAFLDTLNWRGSPASESQRGAGLYTALVLSGEATLEWEDRYFAWLWEESDPVTGLWRKGRIAPVAEINSDTYPAGLPDIDPTEPRPSLLPHLVGTYHYLTTLEYARRPLRYPDRLVDICLDLFSQESTGLGEFFSQMELAWVYCLNRAVRQSGHRFADARSALEQFAQRYFNMLIDVDPETDPDFNDLALLSATTRCLAELQQALPGQIRTVRPLKG